MLSHNWLSTTCPILSPARQLRKKMHKYAHTWKNFIIFLPISDKSLLYVSQSVNQNNSYQVGAVWEQYKLILLLKHYVVHKVLHAIH